MKKLLCFYLAGLMGISALFAGDNNSNVSTGYVRMPVRNSVMNNLDATIFNPAAATELEKGFHIAVQNEFVLRNYSFEGQEMSSGLAFEDSESDNNTYLFPTVMMDYSADNWAGFFILSVPGGGGTVSYSPLVSKVDTNILNGTAAKRGLSGVATNVDLEASSQILGYTLGGAYKFMDIVGISASLRVLQAKVTTKATTALPAPYDTLADREYSALGFGGVFGLNVMPTEKMNIAIRYETPVKMEYESDDAVDYRHDYPAMVGMGIGYQVIPELRIMADYGMNFYKLQAENSDDLKEGDIDNGWSLGLGAEYDVTDRILLSTGVCYTISGGSEESYSSNFNGLPVPNANPDLSRTSIGLGGVVEIIEDLDIELGYMRVLYTGDTDSNGFKYEKEVHCISVGANYHY